MTTTTPDEIIKSLREKKGNVAATAKALSVSRQAVYHHIDTNPAVSKALEEIRTTVDRARKPLLTALREVTFEADEIAKAARDGDVTLRTAARSLVLAKVTLVTNRSERDVMAEIRGSGPCARAFENLLPPIDTTRSEEGREVVSTSLTTKQHDWVRAQPPGTVSALLAETKKFPVVSDSAEEKTQTTFSVASKDAARLRAAAVERGETAQTLLRQVIEVARRSAVKRSVHH